MGLMEQWGRATAANIGNKVAHTPAKDLSEF
jgi:hypothetical protein